MNEKILLMGCKGCGSAIAESFLTLGKIPYLRKEVDYSKDSPDRQELMKYNPLGQVPTLILPNQVVLTETLAIANYVQTRAPMAGLIPHDFDQLTLYWRWSTFLVSTIYPTFTYGDDPGKWVETSEDSSELRKSTDEHRKNMWLVIEKECSGLPWFLQKFSAIDIYIAVMLQWRPGSKWFDEHCPKLVSISKQVAQKPELKGVWNLNFA